MTENHGHDRGIDHLLDLNKEEFSDLFEAAVDRWLDKKFAQFGRWAVYGMGAALFVYFLKLAVSAGVFK